MTIHNFEYLILLAVCFAFPLFFSLVHRKLLKKEKLRIFEPVILLAALPYLVLDIFAVARGYWSFNEKYMTGIKFLNLPFEELLFFTLIPQACLLIWVGLGRYRSVGKFYKDIRNHFNKQINK